MKVQLRADEVTFETGNVLLKKVRAESLKRGVVPAPQLKPGSGPEPGAGPSPEPEPAPTPTPTPEPQTKTLRLVGTLPPELWNRLGTKILPKLKAGADLSVGVEFSVVVNSEAAKALETELRQILDDLGLTGKFSIE
jgi:hypothetical protein